MFSLYPADSEWQRHLLPVPQSESALEAKADSAKWELILSYTRSIFGSGFIYREKLKLTQTLEIDIYLDGLLALITSLFSWTFILFRLNSFWHTMGTLLRTSNSREEIETHLTKVIHSFEELCCFPKILLSLESLSYGWRYRWLVHFLNENALHPAYCEQCWPLFLWQKHQNKTKNVFFEVTQEKYFHGKFFILRKYFSEFPQITCLLKYHWSRRYSSWRALKHFQQHIC